MSISQGNAEDKKPFEHIRYNYTLAAYPHVLLSLLTSSDETLDAYKNLPGSLPSAHLHSALAQWNEFLMDKSERHRDIFLQEAHWLVEQEMRIGDDAGGWPTSSPNREDYDDDLMFSASTQGKAISVLVRAFQLTQSTLFLAVAFRAVRTFEKDILDGGVAAPIGEDGIFFEEVAAYPAMHTLTGFIFALIGLYDFVALTGDFQMKALLERSLSTLHWLLDEFDVNFWTRSNLLHRQLSSPTDLTLHITLFEVLASYSGCQHCAAQAARWRTYQRRLGTRLRYLVSSCCASFGKALLSRVRETLFPRQHISSTLHVCVPITAFPITGGMRTILLKIAEVTSEIWLIEYVTQYVGPASESFAIHRFGTARTHPWKFPAVWLYCLAGVLKCTSLIRHGANYQIIMPQDGIYTAAFAGLVGKLAGVRVVCIDHGNLVSLNSSSYRTERLQALANKPWGRRLIESFLLVWYWPSLHLLASISARLVDHYLIPGVTGDGVEEICKRLGVHQSRITRFANTVDMDRYIVLDAASRAEMREKKGIAADAIIVTTICRLSPEKGIDIALESISYALTQLSPDLRNRVRFVIAGDGILRKQIEDAIYERGLTQTCILWGEISLADAQLLHRLSDIYLYTGIRGGGYSLVMVEAMASGCAVIASAEPLANVQMLAEGRGIIVPPRDVKQTAIALEQLVSNSELRRQMGTLARNYVAQHNTSTIFRRNLIRATYWSGLKNLTDAGIEGKGEKIFSR